MEENWHLVIASRTQLSFPDLPLMVGRSQVKGLSFEELVFKPGEIKTLLQRNYHQSISYEAAQKLAEETEGWITGLLLSAETMWQGLATNSAAGDDSRCCERGAFQRQPIAADFILHRGRLSFGRVFASTAEFACYRFQNVFVFTFCANTGWV